MKIECWNHGFSIYFDVYSFCDISIIYIWKTKWTFDFNLKIYSKWKRDRLGIDMGTIWYFVLGMSAAKFQYISTYINILKYKYETTSGTDALPNRSFINNTRFQLSFSQNWTRRQFSSINFNLSRQQIFKNMNIFSSKWMSCVLTDWLANGKGYRNHPSKAPLPYPFHFHRVF